MKKRIFKTFTALLVLALVLGAFAACVSRRPETGERSTSSASPESYSEIFSLVSANSASVSGGWGYMYKGSRGWDVNLVEETAIDGVSLNSSPAAYDSSDSPSGSGMTGSPDYTGTNLQHDDVDEADIVKTDGRFIYSLDPSSATLTVSSVTPEGVGETVKLSIYSFYNADWDDFDADRDTEKLIEGVDGIVPTEMFLSGGRLIVIGREETYKFDRQWYDAYKNEMTEQAEKYYEVLDPDTRGSFDEYLEHFLEAMDFDGDGVSDRYCKDLRSFCSVQEKRVCAFVFDVSDPFSPVFIGKSGIGGYYVSSRVCGGSLYLVTNQYFYSPDENDASTYVPTVYDESGPDVIEPSCIVMKDGCGRFSYFTVSRVDTETGKLSDVISILGGGSDVYSTSTDMFVYGWSDGGRSSLGALYRSWGDYTDITRIDLTGDKLRVAAETVIEGTPVNQFSFDWYKGYLRVVAKRNSGTYTFVDDIIDKAGLSSDEAVAQRYVDDTALYVLDGELEQIGFLEDCGRGETLRSVRFDGDVGYFVTFRNTDPLFAVDLSDPSSPELLSALKIPGFSTYMHPFGEGLMFGFGSDADVDSGGVRGIKLSMFDVSDKRDVTECAKFIFDDVFYSSASYNHKAILVDAGKNLIGFFTDDGHYHLFGYDPGSGFFEKAKIKVGSQYWSSDARGIYIDGLFYVVSQSSLTVMDLESSEVVCEVDLASVVSTLLFNGGAVERIS